jgi:hypothetical protein
MNEVNFRKEVFMRLPFLVVTLLSIFVMSCGSTQNKIEGSGKVISETREVSGFMGIALESTGDITITQGDTESLSIETDDNILPLLTSKVENGVLVLGAKDNTSVEPSNGIRYTITVKSLERLELSGSGNVQASNLALESLSVDVSGSGNIELAGTVNSQTVNLSGSGNYNGCKLQSGGSSVTVSGSGNVTVTATDTLSVDVSGSGDVSYVGNPNVSQNVNGTGDVKQIESCN